MVFSPFNNVVKRCLQGMDMEEKGKPEEAIQHRIANCHHLSNKYFLCDQPIAQCSISE